MQSNPKSPIKSTYRGSSASNLERSKSPGVPAKSALQRKLSQSARKSPQVAKAAQLQAMANGKGTVQRMSNPNRTGMPDNLKSGIESLSGQSMSDVKVHYNSPKPATLQAHAYAQGNQIHLGPGQERHLPHEAWHVVQQKQGRVKPTKQLRSKVPINDNPGLEREADVMGAKALQMKDAPLQMMGKHEEEEKKS